MDGTSCYTPSCFLDSFVHGLLVNVSVTWKNSLVVQFSELSTVLIIIQFNKTAVHFYATLTSHFCRHRVENPSTVARCHTTLNDYQLTSGLKAAARNGLDAILYNLPPKTDPVCNLQCFVQLSVFSVASPGFGARRGTCKSSWVFTGGNCRHIVAVKVHWKNKLLRGARAPVPHSWRRQWVF